MAQGLDQLVFAGLGIRYPKGDIVARRLGRDRRTGQGMRPRLAEFGQGSDDADIAFGQQARPPGAAPRVEAQHGDVTRITRCGNGGGGIGDIAIGRRKAETLARPDQDFLRMLAGAQVQVQTAFRFPLNAQIFRDQLAPDADDDVFRSRLAR